MKFYSVFGAFLLFSMLTYSQDRSSGISVGFFYNQIKDLTLLPLVNEGPGISLSFITDFESRDLVKNIKISAGIATPMSSIENTRKSVTGSISASANYQKSLSLEGLYIGFNGLLSYRDGFYRNIDQSHAYWTNYLGGGISSSYINNIDNLSKFKISFELPIIGISSRSASDRLYKVDDPRFIKLLALNHRNLKLATVEKYFQPLIEIEYLHKISYRFAYSIFVKSNYLMADIQGSSKYMETQNGLGVKLFIIK